MRIGVDLDNTLIYYDRLFSAIAKSHGLVSQEWVGNKETLRDYIRELPDGEHRWQQLQGYVYGEEIHHAEAFPGAIRFLWRAKQKGHTIYIVSHKTEFAHHDSTVNLRESALKWLTNNNIYSASKYDLVENVFFLPTQQKKIEKFNELKLDVIIDDLAEIVNHPSLDKNINAILYSLTEAGISKGNDFKRFSSWSGVDCYLLGKYTKSDCMEFIQHSGVGIVESCCSYNQGGNSSVWKVEVDHKKIYSLKYYNNDLMHSDRRFTEIQAIESMRKFGLENIPDFVLTDKNLEISLFSHIDAVPIRQLDEEKIDAVVGFIKKLKGMGQKYKFSLASAACLSGKDIIEQINSRLSQIESACVVSEDLNNFIRQSFSPLFEQLKTWSKSNWPGNCDFDANLDIQKQTLTPSDMGIHNMLEDSNKNIYFLDFEYFGFDDPVKTTSDFLLQPQNKIDDKLGKYWVAGMNKIFSDSDDKFLQRLIASWPLYGLCWCLIMLNDFRDSVWLKRLQATEYNEVDRGKVLNGQLNKAIDLLKNIEINYKLFPYLN